MNQIRKTGFTLIEILVVLALTAILLVLVFRPLIDAFNLTSRAGTQIESQTAARTVITEVTTDLSNAMYVYDNGVDSARINLWLEDISGNPILDQEPYGMIEWVTPARQDEQGLQPNQPTDPTTGTPITTGDFALPLQPSRLINRYFIGLRDNQSVKDVRNDTAPGDPEPGIRLNGMPARLYSNRFTEPAGGANDNRFTLYKAVAPAYILDPIGKTNYIPNLSLFHTGSDINNPTDLSKDPLILHDPNFFYDNSLAGDKATAGDRRWAVPGWAQYVKSLGLDPANTPVMRWQNWHAVSTTQLQTRTADAVALDRDDQGHILYFDAGTGLASSAANSRPLARLLIKFTPASIPNDAGTPTTLDASGSEVGVTAAPGYTLQHGSWNMPYDVLLYRALSNPEGDPLLETPPNFYQYVVSTATGQHKIIHWNAAAPPTPAQIAAATDVGPQTNALGFWTNTPQMAFTVDAQKGLVNFAFPQWVLVNDGSNRLPQRYDPKTVNALIDSFPAGESKPVRGLRLDLALQATDSNGLALNTGSLNTPLGIYRVDPSTNNPLIVRVVPGTERIYGPDQRPGPHYGYRTLYARVPSGLGDPGPNQYKINYLPVASAQYNAKNPKVEMGFIQFDSLDDTATIGSHNQSNEDPSPGQHIYRPHSLPHLKFDAAQGNIPADPVEVEYQFQFNRPNDVLKSDYTTRELIAVTLQSRLFDPPSATAQTTDLTQTVKVNNLQR